MNSKRIGTILLLNIFLMLACRAPIPADRPATTTATAAPTTAATVVALSPPELHDTYLSPDGEWRAEIIIYPCVQLDDV